MSQENNTNLPPTDLNDEQTQTELTSPDALSLIKEELTKAQNDYLYLRAEFDNYRRQAIKERADLIRFAGERLAKDLLETLDIFEAALATEVTPETLQKFVSGIELTSQQLKSTLQKHNITEVPCLGQPFDPVVHEALGSEVSETIKEGNISRVFKKAYKFHDKVLRTGQVIVAKAKSN